MEDLDYPCDKTRYAVSGVKASDAFSVAKEKFADRAAKHVKGQPQGREFLRD